VQRSEKICFPKTEIGEKIYDDISLTLRDKHPSYPAVKNWVARFRTGHLSNEKCSRKHEFHSFHDPGRLKNIP
jgi:hypothetical protein